MRDSVRKQLCGIFESKSLTKEQKQKHIRSKNEINKKLKNDLPHYKYARNDVMEKVIKNFRGVKSSNDGVTRTDKEKQREIFRQQVFESKEYSVVKQKTKYLKDKK